MNPELFYPIVCAVFGALVGSFLNVVIYRLPREGLAVHKPMRSMCPQCQHQLQWWENVPLVSWLLLGAKCRSCKADIPVRYVMVEVLTSGLFGFTAHVVGTKHPGLWAAQGPVAEHAVLLAMLYLVAICVAVTYIDFDFKIIPDEITWSGMGLGVLASLAVPLVQGDSWVFQTLASDPDRSRHLAALASSVAGLLVGALSVWGVGWLGSLAFRKEAMGLGDVKYLGLVGAFLGADGVLTVFFLGCITGAVGGLIQRAITGSRYIAFGPYLSLGVLLVALYRRDIVHFLLVTWPGFIHRLIAGS